MTKKLDEEATTTHGYPTFGGIVGDDDHPPGNIIFGHKYNREIVSNRLTGAYANFFVDETDWKWDVFTANKGMEQRDNYSDTLQQFNDKNSPVSVDGFDIWKHVKSKKYKDTKWEPSKERLREPEQKGNELGKDKSDIVPNPATGENDDKIIKKMNKHLQQEK